MIELFQRGFDLQFAFGFRKPLNELVGRHKEHTLPVALNQPMAHSAQKMRLAAARQSEGQHVDRPFREMPLAKFGRMPAVGRREPGAFQRRQRFTFRQLRVLERPDLRMEVEEKIEGMLRTTSGLVSFYLSPSHRSLAF